MSEKVSDFLVKRLSDWGVSRIFGYPGDGINGILGALNRANNQPMFIHTAHEELASLMACAHAKFTGEVGVCLATSGPGAIHLLNGLYDAQADHQPVVAIVGQQARMSLGGRYQQNNDLLALYKDVAGAYVQMVTSPAQVRHVVDRAFRIAQAERTVTCIIVPNDLQREDAVPAPPHEHGALHSGVGYVPPCGWTSGTPRRSSTTTPGSRTPPPPCGRTTCSRCTTVRAICMAHAQRWPNNFAWMQHRCV